MRLIRDGISGLWYQLALRLRRIAGTDVRQRSLTYLTVVFTLLLPIFGALWARSYIQDETMYRVGRGRAIMLSCVRGEIAVWSGPANDQGPVRYSHESNETGYVLTANEMMAYDRSARQYWLAGFGFGESYGMAPRELGPVRCVVMPLWFVPNCTDTGVTGRCQFVEVSPGRLVVNSRNATWRVASFVTVRKSEKNETGRSR